MLRDGSNWRVTGEPRSTNMCFISTIHQKLLQNKTKKSLETGLQYQVEIRAYNMFNDIEIWCDSRCQKSAGNRLSLRRSWSDIDRSQSIEKKKWRWRENQLRYNFTTVLAKSTGRAQLQKDSNYINKSTDLRRFYDFSGVFDFDRPLIGGLLVFASRWVEKKPSGYAA